MPQKPDASAPRHPYMLQLRLSEVQYRGITLVAEGKELSLAAVVRQHIDSALKASKMTAGPHKGKTLYQALEDDPSLRGILGGAEIS